MELDKITYIMSETPHRTMRLWLNFNFHEKDNLIFALNKLSIWGGFDSFSKEDCLISWEYNKEEKSAVMILLNRSGLKEKR